MSDIAVANSTNYIRISFTCGTDVKRSSVLLLHSTQHINFLVVTSLLCLYIVRHGTVAPALIRL